MSGTAPPPFGRPWSERFPGPAPQPLAAGDRMELHDGLRVLGFLPAEWREGLCNRPIGPEPEAVLVLGALAPGIRALRLTFLGPADPAPLGRIRLLYEGRALPVAAVPAAPGLVSVVPGAWALEAPLPPPEELPRPARGRLVILFDRVLPEGGRWVGPFLHAIEFPG